MRLLLSLLFFVLTCGVQAQTWPAKPVTFSQGAVPKSSTPKELQALIDADLKRYGAIIRAQKLKVE